MTILKAPVYGFDEQHCYGILGEIIWDGNRLYTETPKRAKLNWRSSAVQGQKLERVYCEVRSRSKS
jgi:hypothetical protein